MAQARSYFLQFFDPKSNRSLNHHFRERRFRFFKKLLAEKGLLGNRKLRILDIGGTAAYWESMKFENEQVSIVLLNLEVTPVPGSMFESVKGDACDLSQYKDSEFDLVYSNSVIEHLFTKENQIKMASEARRVGKAYYIQTPNYYFPIEPHWVFPLFQFLPFNVRVFLTRNFSLGHIEKAKDRDEAVTKVKEVRLLTTGEMCKLFPDGSVYREKLLGLTKSVTLYRFGQG